MNLRRILTVSVSALVLGAPIVGGPTLIGGLAVASGGVETADLRRAAKEAAAATKALKKGEGQKAVTHAEAAVTLDPRNGEYRKLLGEAYLFAGRFISAAQALNEALSLDPANGRTALNLALAQIATGEWDVARQTLAMHSATIPASDRGLAMALAGDPAGAVGLLMEIARQPGADAKTRQNLALSLALAGQWQQARAIAALDLSPDQVDGRIMQWASFARPQNAYDQVAALLGVTPIADNGQPERLALAQSMTSAVAAARVADPVDTYMPGPAPVEAVAAVAATAVDVAATDVAQGPSITAPSGQQVVFGPRQEIVQAIPTRAVRAETSVASVGAIKPVRADVPSVQRFAKGSWYVQLGAYDSVGVARDAWGRLVKRTPQLKGLTPASASVSTRAGAFQRLSVGGLARADADALCRDVRSDGGNCFVRSAAGDKPASWVRSASR
ncbi:MULTISPECIES: SPOR domain-containing protein [unclassified Sphingomonas]|uniref:SPOR domain-containing protein n=1 Tax=unclassified Sphingomonas TaxID=196159 RepID=UPI0021519D68|nr:MULTISPECIES: SPOR domain-containing protein [unclassified Sphingomonas]MCR5872017.1 tetratricopeptide repeat protein [Sphingomonas sp. J344]UUX99710.1 tetratricopeptide repeat protein [Sphingomonas sp. J315]